MERRTIKAMILPSGEEAELSVDIFVEQETVRMECLWEDQVFRGEGSAYFTAFQRMKDRLLSEGIGLKCYGSLVNAQSSLMTEKVPMVYLLEKGRKPRITEAVCFFDFMEITEFATTEQQTEFSQQWYDSLQ